LADRIDKKIKEIESRIKAENEIQNSLSLNAGEKIGDLSSDSIKSGSLENLYSQIKELEELQAGRRSLIQSIEDAENRLSEKDAQINSGEAEIQKLKEALEELKSPLSLSAWESHKRGSVFTPPISFNEIEDLKEKRKKLENDIFRIESASTSRKLWSKLKTGSQLVLMKNNLKKMDREEKRILDAVCIRLMEKESFDEISDPVFKKETEDFLQVSQALRDLQSVQAASELKLHDLKTNLDHLVSGEKPSRKKKTLNDSLRESDVMLTDMFGNMGALFFHEEMDSSSWGQDLNSLNDEYQGCQTRVLEYKQEINQWNAASQVHEISLSIDSKQNRIAGLETEIQEKRQEIRKLKSAVQKAEKERSKQQELAGDINSDE